MDEFSAFLELAGMLVTDPRTVLLFSLVIWAAVTDVRSRRIPNKITITGLVLGVLYSAFVPFWSDHGLLWSLGGCMVALVLLFPLWMLRVLGAGDVKLMGMVGALVGLDAVTDAMLASLIAAGILAIAYSLRHGKLRLMFANVGRVIHQGGAALATRSPLSGALQGWESVGKLPFGVAVAAGTIGSVTGQHFGFL